MMEALGASQVLSYLYSLTDEFEFHLVSVEKNYDNKLQLEVLKKSLQDKGIFYYPVKYETGKILKNFNILSLAIKSFEVIKKEKIRNIHCRAYFPAIIAFAIKKIKPIHYLFDTRCFSFDERADVNMISRDGYIYNCLKKLEKKLYLNAEAVNMLSYEGKRVLKDNELFKGSDKVNPVTVIPTCVDLARFQFFERNFSKPISIGYVGNTVGWYNFDKTLEVINAIGKVMDYRLLIYNGDQHEFILNKLKEHQIPLEKVTLESVDFKMMPQKLRDIDIAIFYIRPLFSKKASAATKLGEFLAAGIPVITNANVGDHEYYITNYQAGKIIDFENLDYYDFAQIINQIANLETSKRARVLAEKYFSAKIGAENYRTLYKNIF